MTSPELAEEVLDDLDLLRARDPRGLLPAVAGAGAQVRETTQLTREAGLQRATSGGRPRGLVIVGRREGAVAASVLRALLGPASPVTVDVVPGPDLPVWMGPSDIAVVATRTGAGRYAVTPAYEAARRGVVLVGIGAEDAPLHAACASARAPYVPLPASRVQHTALWSLLTPMLLLAAELGLVAQDAADTELVAAALDEAAAECGPARESFVNPAKTLALELLDALPVIVAEGPLAGAAAGRVADQLATLAGLPVTGFRLPDQRVAARTVLGGPLAPAEGQDDFFRDRADDAGRRLRLITIRDADAGEHDGGERDPRSAGEAMAEVLRTAAAHNVPVSALAEHAEPERHPRLARLARQLAVADFSAVYLALALDHERALHP
ncbi:MULTISPECIES: SIS domain-containing protein [unclassified Modestobacter]|uniref:SIS domain-containing protein n=1 Tax=unclassified Modestobacter TaxID=2643866 RepID=UPI0022A9FFAE|nr:MULTISPECIES: SIS domain-containing protein [unclassified Modestobacter]MCZ2812370.1 RpiR family transcriptional regulator [Modestobacter sp. VKM Ac-2979]MCZ2841260.1 RpiR family transcriptional regulator [Modestobacter sp. VKM Ac-2980]MCZ2849979.1 RpiR family transcriptional regulator [Modestobacter sp. VKM Ac-2978]